MAFNGNQWKRHRRRLLRLFTELMSSEQKPLGLLLCEVGNMEDLMDEDGRTRLEEVIVEAFQNAGATEHGEPQFFWSQGETMAAFKAEAEIHPFDS